MSEQNRNANRNAYRYVTVTRAWARVRVPVPTRSTSFQEPSFRLAPLMVRARREILEGS